MKMKIRSVVTFLMILLPFQLFGATSVVPLKKVIPVSNFVLTGKYNSSEKYNFKLPVPERWEVNSARLSFSYTNSTALIKKRSVLLISVGGIPVEQIQLDPKSPSKSVTVRIPGDLLKTGYHSLNFDITQYSEQGGCEDPLAPELWTIIRLEDAEIEYNYTLKNIPERISSISGYIFDPKNPNAPPVNLVYEGLKPEVMKSVALCASGVAIRYDYRSVEIISDDVLRPRMDNILIGVEKFVKDKIKKVNIPEKNIDIKGPFIGVYAVSENEFTKRARDSRADQNNAIIVISGRNDKEVITAAKAFSVVSLPLPDTRSVIPEVPEISEITTTQKNALKHGYLYTLGELGFNSTTFTGMMPIPKGFSFRIPSDSNLKPNKHAILSLNIAYGASMRKDSVLNIELNDKFVAAVPCDEPAGGSFNLYKIRLSATSLQPGFNKIVFKPQLTTFSAEKCSLIQQGNLRLTIFDDSSFSLPVMESWIEMPELKAFMGDGYPFSSSKTLDKTLVAIPDKSNSSFMAAVNMIALISQKTGLPPFDLKFSFEVPEKQENNIIVVSKAASIPDFVNNNAPMSLKGGKSVKYPQVERAKGMEDREQKGLFSKIFSSELKNIKKVEFKDFDIILVHMDPYFVKGRAALVEFQNPYDPSGTILVFSTSSDEDMLRGAQAIWDPGVQASSKGDTVLINLMKKDYETVSQKLGSSYYIGEVSPVPMLDYYANSYPLWFIIVIILTCLLLSVILYYILRNRKQKRLKDAQSM